MRIRAEFVTNSSSTNFVLKSVISGQLPPIPFEDLSRLLDKYRFNQERDSWAKFARTLSNSWPGESGTAEVEIKRGAKWNKKKRVHELTDFVFVEINSPVISTKLQAKICLREATSIFEKIASCTSIDFAVLFYFQHVCELIGDGWDQGDPGGVYSWSHEVLRDQTRVGDIFIIDGRVSMKLSEPEVNTSLIDGAEELIESPGQFLPAGDPIRPSPSEKGTKWIKLQ